MVRNQQGWVKQTQDSAHGFKPVIFVWGHLWETKCLLCSSMIKTSPANIWKAKCLRGADVLFTDGSNSNWGVPVEVPSGAVRFQPFQAFWHLLNLDFVLTIEALSKIKTFAGSKTSPVMKGLLLNVVETGWAALSEQTADPGSSSHLIPPVRLISNSPHWGVSEQPFPGTKQLLCSFPFPQDQALKVWGTKQTNQTDFSAPFFFPSLPAPSPWAPGICNPALPGKSASSSKWEDWTGFAELWPPTARDSHCHLLPPNTESLVFVYVIFKSYLLCLHWYSKPCVKIWADLQRAQVIKK